MILGALIVSEENDDKLAEIKGFFVGRFREHLDGLAEELLTKEVQDLEAAFSPTQTDWLIRHRFWNLVEIAEAHGAEGIPTVKIFTGICSRPFFYDRWIVDQRRLAWLLCPIAREKLEAQELYHHLAKKLRKYILNTEVDSENLDSMTKLLMSLTNRAFGPPVQRIQAHTITENRGQNSKELSPVTDQEIRDKIRELEDHINTRATVVVDVGEEKNN